MLANEPYCKVLPLLIFQKSLENTKGICILIENVNCCITM